MAKRQLKWEMNDAGIKCNWLESEMKPLVFIFADLPGFELAPPEGITFSFFRHGLKQKLADCTAGASNNGATVEMQQATMSELWKEFCKGNFTSRKAKAPTFTKAMILKLALDAGLNEESMAMLEEM